MSTSPDRSEWLTVSEVAEIEGVSTETVRRGISAGKYPASRASDAPHAPWLINAATYERRRKADAERAARRERLAGMGGGYGPAGRKAAVEAAARHSGLTEDEAAAELRRLNERDRREELLAHAERELRADPATRQRLEQLDDDARIEAEARELAARVRRAERIQKRAREILEEEGDETE